MKTLNIGRVAIQNPMPAIVADLVAAGWVYPPAHERWMKRILIPAEVGNRAGTAAACVKHLGVRPCEALDRAVTALLDLVEVTGALSDPDCRGLQVMASGERFARSRAA